MIPMKNQDKYQVSQQQDDDRNTSGVSSSMKARFAFEAIEEPIKFIARKALEANGADMASRVRFSFSNGKGSQSIPKEKLDNLLDIASRVKAKGFNTPIEEIKSIDDIKEIADRLGILHGTFEEKIGHKIDGVDGLHISRGGNSKTSAILYSNYENEGVNAINFSHEIGHNIQEKLGRVGASPKQLMIDELSAQIFGMDLSTNKTASHHKGNIDNLKNWWNEKGQQYAKGYNFSGDHNDLFNEAVDASNGMFDVLYAHAGVDIGGEKRLATKNVETKTQDKIKEHLSLDEPIIKNAFKGSLLGASVGFGITAIHNAFTNDENDWSKTKGTIYGGIAGSIGNAASSGKLISEAQRFAHSSTPSKVKSGMGTMFKAISNAAMHAR